MDNAEADKKPLHQEALRAREALSQARAARWDELTGHFGFANGIQPENGDYLIEPDLFAVRYSGRPGEQEVIQVAYTKTPYSYTPSDGPNDMFEKGLYDAGDVYAKMIRTGKLYGRPEYYVRTDGDDKHPNGSWESIDKQKFEDTAQARIKAVMEEAEQT